MTAKSSEQNLKSVRLALRIQSILSSAHGDLIPSSAPSLSQAVCFLRLFVAFFLCLLCFFCVFVLSVRSYVFPRACSLFSSPVPTIGLKIGALEFLMVFRFSVAVFFRLRPAAMPHLQKSVFAMFAQLRRKQFSPPAEYKTGIAKQNRFAILL